MSLSHLQHFIGKRLSFTHPKRAVQVTGHCFSIDPRPPGHQNGEWLGVKLDKEYHTMLEEDCYIQPTKVSEIPERVGPVK